MRLDDMTDGSFASDIFSFEVKNHKAYFSVKGDKHVFGSKFYPIGKRAGLFMSTTTTDGDIHEVADIIENRSNWSPRHGYCYTNAEILHQVMIKLGYDAKYYSGWLFTGGNYPIHHAWVVYKDNVYDISINNTSYELMKKQALEGRNPRSKECVRAVKESEKNWKPLVDNFIWGKVPEHMIYVGAEATPTSARIQYDKATGSDISKHPSYKHMKKDNKFDKSPYQKLFDEV